MSKIIGVTVGTPLNPDKYSNKQKVLLTDDGEGNVAIELVDVDPTDPDAGGVGGGGAGGIGGGGVAVIVDDKLNTGSTNPVQNRVIAYEIDHIRDLLGTVGDLATTNRQTLDNNVSPRITALETGLSSVSTQAINAENVANDATTVANDARYTANLVQQGLELSVLPRLDALEDCIGNIDADLDDIIAIQDALIGGTVTLITFTVDGIAYQAEEGMAWWEWCQSEYNSVGAHVEMGCVYFNGGAICYGYGGDGVGEDDIIRNDVDYVVD